MGIAEIIEIIEIVNFALELSEAIENGVNYIIEKFVDSSGNVCTRIVYRYDSTGDGVEDSEEIIYTLQQTIPKLYDGYCLVNKGNEIGLGQPSLKLVDASELLPILGDTYSVISDGEGIKIDFDDDGFIDDIFFPAPYDFSGDGINDWYQIVDDDDNGLPDCAPGTPFYSVGSDEYNYIIETQSDTEVPALDKSFANYTVTEALLFLIFVAGAIGVGAKFFKRRNI
ncbi:MAG: hypothetical protein J1F28_00530 [Oscillospiraceae bacterium]|nr:hypothetical protein [Oscillospiraceae bacterium]